MTQQSSDFPDSFARITVKGLYIKDGKIMLSRDEIGTPVWELPGGGWDFGETFEETLKREAKEEMGLEITSVSEKPLHMWTVRRDNVRGMDWFYVLYVLFRVDFKDLNFTPSTECTQLGFFTYDEFQALDDLLSQSAPLKNLLTKEDFK